MSRLGSLARFALHARHRTAAALLALQVVFALEPVMEPTVRSQSVVHADEQGTHHAFGHDAASCIACAARTVVADTPEVPSAVPAAATDRAIAESRVAWAPTRARAPDNPSRAPPAPR